MAVNEKPPQEKYLDAKYVVDNPNKFDHRDVARAQEYVNGFEDAQSIMEKALHEQYKNIRKAVDDWCNGKGEENVLDVIDHNQSIPNMERSKMMGQSIHPGLIVRRYLIYADDYGTWNEKIGDWDHNDEFTGTYSDACEYARKKYGKKFTIPYPYPTE